MMYRLAEVDVFRRVNGKLGGVNFVLDKSSGPVFNNPQNPTIVMGVCTTQPVSLVNSVC